jgi:hypothetical protein
VKRRKAARPASPEVRQPRGSKINTNATPDPLAMQVIYAGTMCLGFVYSRGKFGFEAFDASTHSLGLFPDRKSAADAIAKQAKGGSNG